MADLGEGQPCGRTVGTMPHAAARTVLARTGAVLHERRAGHVAGSRPLHRPAHTHPSRLLNAEVARDRGRDPHPWCRTSREVRSLLSSLLLPVRPTAA